MEENIVQNERRTFAIISHPDAGKTTLTEKLLLYGGGNPSRGIGKSQEKPKTRRVRLDGNRKAAGGFPLPQSVLQFDYQGYRVNILDTPGPPGFQRRHLPYADGGGTAPLCLSTWPKGSRSRQKKLFRVCKDRGIPIFTFVNKLDRFGRNPFELMEEAGKCSRNQGVSDELAGRGRRQLSGRLQPQAGSGRTL